MSPELCRELIAMMRSVISMEGTAPLAAIPGYTVSGKTGTAWKADGGSYEEINWVSVFAGVAPASAPRLAAAVFINNPQNGIHLRRRCLGAGVRASGWPCAAPDGGGAGRAGGAAGRLADGLAANESGHEATPLHAACRSPS